MKVLNKCKVEILNGKVENKEVLRKDVKVVDSVADDLIVDSEQAQKRQINITGVAELSASGDKINKRASVVVWEVVKKKAAPKKDAPKK